MMSTTTAPPCATAPPLTKKQKGRLKKLRRRIQEVKKGCETSGIVSTSDWTELESLDPTLVSSAATGPAVKLRSKSAYGNANQRTEGADNRDLLFQLLQRTSQTKKRAREQAQAPIPSWATLHNPVATQSIAVVELQLEEVVDWGTLTSKLTALKQQDDSSPYAILPTETTWFQGPQPKSISDVLMHVPRDKKSSTISNKKRRKLLNDKTDANAFLSCVVSKLQTMILKHKQRVAQGYPIMQQQDDSDDNDTETIKSGLPEEVILPTSFSLEHAKRIVATNQVSIADNANNDDDNETDERPYITCHSDPLYPPRVFGVDCEMVKTERGSELARVTLVRLTGVDNDMIEHQVVMDELVKPDRPVLDYLTQYSGITPEKLQPITTRLTQVQASLLRIIRKKDILVGHSLENDLMALRLVHERVVDTAMAFRSEKCRKYSLRHLSAALLGNKIQEGGDSGHCSEEDAVAALHLAVRRALEGPSFRIYAPDEERLHVLECIQEQSSVVCVGPGEWIQSHVTTNQTAAHALSCESIHDSSHKALAAWLSSTKRRAKLVWANFATKGDDQSIQAINDTLNELFQRMLPGTIVLVAMQRSHEAVAKLAKQRKACRNPKSSLGWSDNQEQNWIKALDNCRSGIAFWIGAKCEAPDANKK